jgi:hypothetical protein
MTSIHRSWSRMCLILLVTKEKGEKESAKNWGKVHGSTGLATFKNQGLTLHKLALDGSGPDNVGLRTASPKMRSGSHKHDISIGEAVHFSTAPTTAAALSLSWLAVLQRRQPGTLHEGRKAGDRETISLNPSKIIHAAKFNPSQAHH